MIISLWNHLQTTFKSFVQLFSNPTSIYLAVLIFVQLSVAVVLSALAPFVIRRYVLPSSIQTEVPLNLIFSPCSEGFHGICSYPTAEVDVAKNELFSPSITYALTVRLRFADIEGNLGLFQNKISILHSNQTVLGQWYKSAYLKKPGLLMKAVWTFFFPLYFIGFFDDYHTMEICLTHEYLSSVDAPASKLIYTLQDSLAQIDSASLLVNARFGLIRYLLYYWPIMSYIVIFALSLTGFLSLLTFYWGALFVRARVDKPEIQEEQIPEEHIKQDLSLKEILQKPVEDEYLPDNVDEVPECSSLDESLFSNTSITNNVPESSNSLRKRK